MREILESRLAGPPAEKSAGLPERVGKRLPLLNATHHDQLCARLQSHRRLHARHQLSILANRDHAQASSRADASFRECLPLQGRGEVDRKQVSTFSKMTSSWPCSREKTASAPSVE